LQGRDTIEKSA
jgi:hypothetical protein